MTNAAHPSPFVYIKLAFPPADRIGALVELYHSPQQNLYGLNVLFVARRPEHEELDRVLRECTALAAAHDGSIDIVVAARFLPSASSDPALCEALDPYGRSHFLCYDANSRRIGLRRIGKKGLVHEARAADKGSHADRGPMDDATDDMLADIEGQVWYGFGSAGDLDALIEQRAADGDGFDVDRVKAFAATTLAKKLAAEAQWPHTTDCDKLDRVFSHLQAQRICALQCAGSTLDDGYEAVSDAINAEGVPEDRYMGYCFFHSQDIDRALAGEGLQMAFGYLDSDDAKDAIPVGRTICEALRQEGFETDWNGSPKRRIGVPSLRWQRRTPG